MQARRIIKVGVLLALGGLVGGCASVQIKPIAVSQVNDPDIAGVRFFQPQPYLLVTQMPSMPAPPEPMMRQGIMGPPMEPMKGRMSCPMMWRSPGGLRHGLCKPMMNSQNMNRPNHRPGDMVRKPLTKNHGMACMIDRKGASGMHGHRMMGGHQYCQIQPGRMLGLKPPTPGMPMPVWKMRRLPPPQRIFKLQIIYLPDYSHPYVADIQGGLGHSSNSLVLANGWELLGLNVKGSVAQSKPITAITVAPAQRKEKKWTSHHKPWGHGGMMHPMLMPRHTAMAMGLRPGLYRFVYNAKTGKLAGLRRIRLLKPHHWHGMMSMMKWKKSNRHEPHPMLPAAVPAKGSGK